MEAEEKRVIEKRGEKIQNISIEISWAKSRRMCTRCPCQDQFESLSKISEKYFVIRIILQNLQQQVLEKIYSVY
jgi:hypothetical protein